MFVGLGTFDLRLPECSSLKDKRSVLRSLTSLVRQKFNASVAEVDHQELRQRATLAVSLVADTSFHAQRVLREVERHVSTHPGVEVLRAEIDLLTPER